MSLCLPYFDAACPEHTERIESWPSDACMAGAEAENEAVGLDHDCLDCGQCQACLEISRAYFQEMTSLTDEGVP